jgi:hypothetical protein
MSDLLDHRPEIIGQALESTAPGCEHDGKFGWQFELDPASGIAANARLDGDWLLLTSDASTGWTGDDAPWDVLQRNAQLPGLEKFAVDRSGRLRLQAEIPLAGVSDFAARIQETVEGFRAALTQNANDEVAAGSAQTSAANLKQLCTEAGWPFIEREATRLAIELETPRSFYQAVAVPAGSGVRLHCDLAALEAPPEPVRAAVGELLLATCGVLRLARTAIIFDGSSAIARLEVKFALPPSPPEISSALESLSVGCSICGEEIKTLQDPAIARRFLECRNRGAAALA